MVVRHLFACRSVLARVRVALLVVVLLLAGCTSQEKPAAPSGASPEPEGRPSATPEGPPAKRSLEVSLSVAQRWVKPQETVDAQAQTRAGVSVAWYLAPRNPVVPGQEDEAIQYVPRTLGVVELGGTSMEARMDVAGRYSFAASARPDARFNVTVSGSLTQGGTREVRFVEDAFGARFSPAELEVGPGVSVYVRNAARASVEPVRVDQMARVAPDGLVASFAAPTLLGDYDLVALARDGADGWGEAAARLIVDARRPDENATFGPFEGRLDASAPAGLGGAPHEHEFASRFALRDLNVTFSTKSDAPLPASIVVRLLVNGTKVGEGPASDAGNFQVASLPPGRAVVQVEIEQGVGVAYSVLVRGTNVLVPPASFFNT